MTTALEGIHHITAVTADARVKNRDGARLRGDAQDGVGLQERPDPLCLGLKLFPR